MGKEGTFSEMGFDSVDEWGLGTGEDEVYGVFGREFY